MSALLEVRGMADVFERLFSRRLTILAALIATGLAVIAAIVGTFSSDQSTNWLVVAASLIGASAAILTFAFAAKARRTERRVERFARLSDHQISSLFDRAASLAVTLNASQAYQFSLGFCDFLLSRALTITPVAERAAIWVPEPDGDSLLLYSSKAREPRKSAHFSPKLTVSSTAAHALEAGTTSRVTKDLGTRDELRPNQEYRYSAYICVPIRTNQSKVAVMTLDTSKSRAFTIEDERRLEKLVQKAAPVLLTLLTRAAQGKTLLQLARV